ncbi:MAG TPA: hypothetical protein VN698_12765 [Bacteroidia bacterium]|nr:hypothetical protein [Bacteroidia bacterium]
MRLTFILFFTLLFQLAFAQTNCNCNEKEIEFSEGYVNANNLIFRGKTLSTSKGTDYDKVTFSVSKLFKGTAAQQIDVYFDAKNPCVLKFGIGEDWLIYANYKSGKPLLLYCSRSRKNVINTNKNIDLMYVKSDLTIDDETEKLTELCGLKAFAKPVADTESAHDNIIPTGSQRILLIIFSVIGFALIYFVLNKVMKK